MSETAEGIGGIGDSMSLPHSVSGDGRYVVFESMATNFLVGEANIMNLVPTMEPFMGDCVFACTSGFAFVKDRETGRVAQVTMGMNGVVPDVSGQADGILSSNGEYVSFHSYSTNLVPMAS